MLKKARPRKVPFIRKYSSEAIIPMIVDFVTARFRVMINTVMYKIAIGTSIRRWDVNLNVLRHVLVKFVNIITNRNLSY